MPIPDRADPVGAAPDPAAGAAAVLAAKGVIEAAQAAAAEWDEESGSPR